MSEEAFKEYFKVVRDDIENNRTTVSSEDFKNVKLFLKNNPENFNSKFFINWLINIYQKPFVDFEFIEALGIPDNQKYRKMQQIIKYFPLKWENFQYRLYFYNLFHIEDSVDFWTDCINFFKDQGKCWIPQNIIDSFTKFKDENMKTITSSRDEYQDYDTELNSYKMLLDGKIPEDFDNFKDSIRDKHLFSEYELLKNYENKKIGNIGEIFIFEKIKHMPNAIFTSKDIGNGFGFDMYYQIYENYQITENLVEVKSTTNLEGNDFIKLTENEYDVMINLSNEPNVNYYICRVFIDINKQEFEYYFLKLEGNTLKDINNNIEYEVDKDDKYSFKRKQKTLTIKR